MKNEKLQKAVTLIELLITIAILTISVGLASYYHLGVIRSTSIDGYTNGFIQVINEARSSAIGGRTKNGSASDFGVYLENDGYTIFSGSTYAAGDNSNIKTPLPGYMTIDYSNLFGQSIIFTSLTGEIQSFDPAENQLIIKDNQGKQKNLTINKVGVIDIQ
ncbi:MAG: Uncharacterized protein CEN88_398 [Candidatus Berkelbacteria bacterium Licking1014_2]|uniref:Prepilin-type N-terminal cleavage/methylation domain-containing protein n=1 Tax=Candidatus Berkelbacteria bacterium Licking1014_2 TaxID=2017146 RepID=A0A554LTA0_9BACT|nr:MAG: Uncharacterized protein CEN88_398 [Candidatus Berkelbacteria bacterium Licking1014_2]